MSYTEDSVRARERIARQAERVGLCAHCVHLKAASADRKIYVRCGLAGRDERFPRYPVLPVIACRGYEPRGDR